MLPLESNHTRQSTRYGDVDILSGLERVPNAYALYVPYLQLLLAWCRDIGVRPSQGVQVDAQPQHLTWVQCHLLSPTHHQHKHTIGHGSISIQETVHTIPFQS